MTIESERFRRNAKECRRLAAETGDEEAAKHLQAVAEDLDEAATEIEEEEAQERRQVRH